MYTELREVLPQYVKFLNISIVDNARAASLIMWITLVFGYVLLADSEEQEFKLMLEPNSAL